MRRMTQWGMRMLAIVLVCALCVLRMPQARAEMDGMVRVLLTRLGSVGAIEFQTTCDYGLQGADSAYIPSGTAVTVSASGSTLTVAFGGVRHTSEGTMVLRRGASGRQGVRFTSPSMQNLYCGDLILAASDSKVAVILNIYIEDYLYGVVGYEMSPAWHIEALKAQAVTARNYVLQMMLSRESSAYHVTDNTSNQVFKGLNTASNYTRAVQAVDETRGMVLYSDGALARCYYSASNGGQTESTRNAWGTALKYSVVKDDPYDYTGGGTVRSASIAKNASDLKPELRVALTDGIAGQLTAAGVRVAENGVTLEEIVGIEPVSPRYDAPSRLYASLAFTVRATVRNTAGESCTGSLIVNVPSYGGVENWYGLSINSGKTETVWVTGNDEAFQVSFRRNGHGVGLSQWGAQTMADKHGMSCMDILQFYFPGTTIQRLSLNGSEGESLPSPAPDADAPAETMSEVVIPDWEMYARAAENVSILKAPDFSAAAVGTMSGGSYGKVQAYTRSWVLLEASGVTGFVSIGSLTPATAAEALAIPDIPEVEDVPANGLNDTGVVIPDGDMYVRALSRTAVHSAADIFSGALGVLAEGGYAQVLAYTRSWMLLETDAGVRGFVPAEDLTPVPAWEAQAIPEFEVQTFAGEMRVCVASAGLYERADANSAQAALLPYGTLVEVGGAEDGWTHVRLGEQMGYICSDELTERSLTAKSARDIIAMNFFAETTGDVLLYAGPGAGSGTLGALESGLRLEVHAYNDAFALVSVGQTYGFVEIKMLNAVI